MKKNKDKHEFEEFIETETYDASQDNVVFDDRDGVPTIKDVEEMEDVEEVEDIELDNPNGLPFTLVDDGRMIFRYGFNYNDCIVEDSKMLFETPLLKPYISKFACAKNKNITMANVFKLCVLLNCSPNDLFNWDSWRNKVGEAISVDDFSPLTTEEIKGLL